MVFRSLLLALLFLLVACATLSTADSFVAQGKEVAKEKKYEEALAYYEKALAVEPNNTSALYNAGVACAKLARNDKAIEYFQKTISSGDRDNYSHSQDAHYNIASIKLTQGKYKEAIEAALSNRPETDDIIKKALEKLKESGFQYAPYVQPLAKIEIPYPTDMSHFIGAKWPQEKVRVMLVAAIDNKGQVLLTKCYGMALCEYASDYIKHTSFLPAYDFTWDGTAASVTYFSIMFLSNAMAAVSWKSIVGAAPNGRLTKPPIIEEKDGAKIILGAIHRRSIDETVKRNLNHVLRCYEKELPKNHNLEGKIVVKFTISQTGEVTSTETYKSTMNNDTVEECVNSQIGKMLFPVPTDNGIVIVTYPFIFKHTD